MSKDVNLIKNFITAYKNANRRPTGVAEMVAAENASEYPQYLLPC